MHQEIDKLTLVSVACCRPPNFKAPVLPDWKSEEPDSPKIDHALDGMNLPLRPCFPAPHAWQLQAYIAITERETADLFVCLRGC